MVHSNGQSKNTGSPKVEVGEIDTRAPFQSVKDAVNLFGEVAFSGRKPAIKKANPNSAERVLVKESELHLAQKELNKLKDQLKNAENTKSDALIELDKAKKTVESLSQKISVLSESKEASLQSTAAAKNHAKQLEDANSGLHKDDSENAREESVLTELNSAKQELAKTRQDFNLSLEVKACATKKVEEAEIAVKVNAERASEISIEIAALKETIEQVKQATLEAQHEQSKSVADKVVERQAYKSRLEESSKKLLLIKKEFDPEVAKNLEAQLADTVNETEGLKRDVEKAKESDLDAVKKVTLELDGAKDSLKKILEDDNALRREVESLKLDLESLKKEHAELKEKEAETNMKQPFAFSHADTIQKVLLSSRINAHSRQGKDSKELKRSPSTIMMFVHSGRDGPRTADDLDTYAGLPARPTERILFKEPSVHMNSLVTARDDHLQRGTCTTTYRRVFIAILNMEVIYRVSNEATAIFASITPMRTQALSYRRV